MTIYANNLWAAILVEQLARCGLRAVCIAPGSRSTPLTLAFAHHPQIQVYLHLDERSAAFFALGMAQASQRPVALVCTSGTAAAEFHPAIVEAFQAEVPLLILTADRPPELRGSGANQTIDQVKMFGDHVLWAVDAPLPQPEAPALALRNLQTLASRAYAMAQGPQRGPVHMNLPFRKPLEPDQATALETYRQQAAERPGLGTIERGLIVPSPAQLDAVAATIRSHAQGLIVCGPSCPGGEFPAAVTALAAHTGYPILADPLSGVRFGPHVNEWVLGSYESFLANTFSEKAEVVLRFGAVPTSAPLNAYLDRIAPAHLIHVRESGVWADDSHRVTQFLAADAAMVCHELQEALPPRADTSWAESWIATAQSTQTEQSQALTAPFIDASVIPILQEELPAHANLMVGNSLPVRHLDQFGAPTAKALSVYGNRGASGIDGLISTALGIAATDPTHHTVLLIGDVSFYHDMNGLLALRQHDLHNVTIVLLNNNGGGIFRRLPVQQFEPEFTHLFLTPHGLRFEHVAALYDLRYRSTTTGEDFRQALRESFAAPAPTLIEVQTNGVMDHERRREIMGNLKR